jgi:hypothetical protein
MCGPARSPDSPPATIPAAIPQLEEWECPISDGQRAILEAIAAVLGALLRDLARSNRVDM